jgi:hypothetical protein
VFWLWARQRRRVAAFGRGGRHRRNVSKRVAACRRFSLAIDIMREPPARPCRNCPTLIQFRRARDAKLQPEPPSYPTTTVAVHGEVVLRPRVCRSRGCQATFWICSHCDRRQCYCSPVCRTEARRQQRRAANGRHQRSLEGWLDHRDRQRAYRRRHAPARVTDQGSLSAISPAPFGCGETITMPVAVPLPSALPGGLENRSDLWLRCSICGRPGRFVDPFPQIPRRR